MNRKAYLRAQKDQGRKVMGVFPAQYPRELLWALNILPVEIWDPPAEPGRAAGHLQPYICSIVRQGLELLLQGGADDCDAFLFPHTCDSIQNLASVVNDYIGQDKPCYFFYHPKAPYGAPARSYYRGQLQALAQELEPLAGPLDPAQLQRRVIQGQTIAGLTRQIYDLRAANALTCSNAQLYQALRRGEWTHPDDLIPYLEGFLAGAQGQGPAGPRLLLSGVLPNPPEIMALLDELGAVVAADDLIIGSRRSLFSPSAAADPLEALTEQYFCLPPCSTKDSALADRLAWLQKLAQQSRAQGVVFFLVKFCEPELFDLPILGEELKKLGLPTLTIDCEINQGLSGQIATRVEAFVEMLG